MSLPTAEDLVESDYFRDMIVRNLHKPENATGLQGPMRAGDRWETWLHRLLEGKITKKYYRGEDKLRPVEWGGPLASVFGITTY